MTMPDNIVGPVVGAARKRKIDENASLAVVEIESGGKALEPADNRTPQLLFERHVFWKYLPEAKRSVAIQQGLTYGEKWQRNIQYKDQGTSAKRLDLLNRARKLDEEAANKSCSWGLGQTMGFLCTELGYPSATAMVKALEAGGVPAQVEAMFREIENKHLTNAMNTRQWAVFARAYNGPGYRENQYDSRMAAAYARWAKVANKPSTSVPIPSPGLTQPPPPPVPKKPIPASDVGRGKPPAKPVTKATTGAVIAAGGATAAAAGSGMSTPEIIALMVAVVLVVGGIVYWITKD